jgi:leucyl/phenylalanyl-tRNA---protein transferase
VIPVPLLVAAYRGGFFPMAVEGQICWFSPDPRGVLPLEAFHVSRRLARRARTGGFELTVNRSFRDVIVACGSRHDPDGDWIDAEIIDSYVALHEAGLAHSVEVRREGRLTGGLYGVTLGGAFFGESMFNHEPDTAKIALQALVERLRTRGFMLLDIQWLTPFLASLGAVEIPRAEYLARLTTSLACDCRFAD